MAAAEANVPEAPPVDDAPSLSAQAPLILLAILWTQVRTALSPNLILWSRSWSESSSPLCHDEQWAPNQWKKDASCEKSPKNVGFSALRKIYIYLIKWNEMFFCISSERSSDKIQTLTYCFSLPKNSSILYPWYILTYTIHSTSIITRTHMIL